MRLFSASLSNIGQLFGSITMGIAMGAIGRKKTIMVFCLPLLAGWIIVGMSEKIGGPKQVMCICVGRVFQGIGIMSSVTQTYLVEVADAERRKSPRLNSVHLVRFGIFYSIPMKNWEFYLLNGI